MSNPDLLLYLPPIIPIKKISPTRFLSFKSCYLKGVWESNNSPSLLPTSPYAIIGRVVHKVMEYVGEGKIETNESFEENWELLIRQEEEKLSNSWLESHLVPLSSSVRNYDEKKELCRLLVKSSFKSSSHYNLKNEILPTTKHEIWLQTRDGIFVGKIDLLKVSDNFIEVIDYKSIETIDSKVLNEYCIQLKLYGALYHETYGIWPSSLIIMLINNERVEVPFTTEECKDLLNHVQEVFHGVNDIISKSLKTKDLISKLANPSPQICYFCNFRPVCTPYWEARESSPEEPWPSDLKGKLVRKGPWGKNRIYIEVEIENKEMIKVVDLLPERHPALENPNYEIAVYSLNKDKKNPRIFHEGQLTVVYLTPKNLDS